MEQVIRNKTEARQETMEILQGNSQKTEEEDLKKEILNYLLDEESGFEV